MPQGFEHFINKDIGKATSAELLSLFCDSRLRTGQCRLRSTVAADTPVGGDRGEGDIEATLEAVVTLFSYLTDKVLVALVSAV